MLSRLMLKPAGGSGNAGLSSGPNSIVPPNPPPRPPPGGVCARPVAAARTAANKAERTGNFICRHLQKSSVLAQRLLDRRCHDGRHDLVAISVGMQTVSGKS